MNDAYNEDLKQYCVSGEVFFMAFLPKLKKVEVAIVKNPTTPPVN